MKLKIYIISIALGLVYAVLPPVLADGNFDARILPNLFWLQAPEATNPKALYSATCEVEYFDGIDNNGTIDVTIGAFPRQSMLIFDKNHPGPQTANFLMSQNGVLPFFAIWQDKVLPALGEAGVCCAYSSTEIPRYPPSQCYY